MGPEILVRLTRGKQVESAHHGAYCVICDGKIVRSRGDIETATFFRSAAKPFQALAVVESGAPERFGFTDPELAMVMGSHSGSRLHAETAAAMLEKIGEDASLLRCGGHRPLSRAVYEEYLRKGVCWGRLEDNCSGKHAGMIGAAKAWGEDCATYAEPSHLVQLKNLANVSLFTGIPERSIGIGTDGCGVPSFAVSVRAMACAIALYATPEGFDEKKTAAARKIMEVAIRHPEMVAGEGRFDTVVMRAGGGRLISKEGAEGVQVIGVAGERTGIAVKIADGGQRARQAVAARLLVELGLVEREVVVGFLPRPILDREGIPVGDLEVEL